MRGRYFLYLLKAYGKNLLLMLMAISLTITLIDYLHDSARLSDAGNQLILYLFYTWEYRVSQFYPLAIVFAAVITYMSLVQSNTLVSLYAFGYTRRELLLPFVIPAWLLYGAMLLLQSGEFAYAKERAWSIAHHQQSVRAVDDLFFKYDNSFVYVKALDPIRKILKDVTIFELEGQKVVGAVMLESAHFDGEYWIAKHARIQHKHYTQSGLLKGFQHREVTQYRFLKGYKPKVIELIYEGESLSLIDALNTYRVLLMQGLDTAKIKALLYSKTLLPLFSLAVIMILFFKTPYYSRYMNRELVWSLYIGGTLGIWGLLYALSSLSSGGAVSAELAIVFPVLLLLAYAFSLLLGSQEKLL